MADFSISGALSSAARALHRNQQRLTLASRNVSGAADPQYSRQSLATQATATDEFSVLRQRDLFLDRNYRSAAAESAFSDAQRQGLAAVESALGEPSESGLAGVFSRFWDGWERLSGSAHDPTARNEVIGAAQALAFRLNGVGRDLENQRLSLTTTLGTQVQEMNSLSEQLVGVNRKLMTLKPGTTDAAGVADRRDALLDRMAELGGAETLLDPDGQVTVLLSGRALVSKGALSRLTTAAAGVPQWEDGQAVTVGGAMAGLRQVLVEDLPRVRTEVDRLADSLAAGVNALHRTGYGLDGGTNRDFFTTGAGARGLSLLVTGPEQVAAAAVSGAAGNGQIASQIADLRDDVTVVTGGPLDGGSGLTPDRHLQALFADTGLRVATARNEADISGRQLTAVDQERRSVTGVSLDEEALQLMELQKAMMAATRVVTALDDVLDRLISFTGRVGR